MALYAFVALGNPYAGLQADDAIYLLMADIYSPWRAADADVYAHVRAHSQLPPLLPLMLGWVGAGTDALEPARLAVAAFMAAAVALYFRWCVMLGAPRTDAAILTATFALLPVTVIHVSDVWSEGLYLALSLLSLLALRHAAETGYRPVAALACGFLVALAIAARTAGVALLPVLVVASVRGPWRRTVWLWAGFVVCELALTTIDMGRGGTSYTDLLTARYAAAPLDALSAQLSAGVPAAWSALGYDMFGWRAPGALQLVLLILFAALVAIGLAAGLRRAEPAAIYVAVYVGIVVLWPFAHLMDRFLLPAVPFLLWFAYCGAGVAAGATRRTTRGLGARVAIVAIAAAAAPNALATAGQLFTPMPDARFESFRRTRYWLDATRSDASRPFAVLHALHTATGTLGEHVPPGECIHTRITQLVLLNAKRVAWPFVAEARLRAGDPGPCRYHYVTAETQRAPFYPLALIESRVDVVAVHRADVTGATERPVVGLLLRRRSPAAPPAAGD